MSPFDGDLLRRPAGEAARVIARAHLNDAAAAAVRLSHHDDDEALHDFRVAIRRLRVTIGAYPELKDHVPKKQRRRLRKLARATNPGRDLEVQIAWFRAHAQEFTATQRSALRGLRARLNARSRRERTRAETELARRFAKLERKLRRQLELAESDGGAEGRPFRSVAAATVLEHATELRRRLGTAMSPGDAADLHAARIAAKRLRYVLEPLAARLPEEALLLQRLKQLQDMLGEMNDAHVLKDELDRVVKPKRDVAGSVSAVEEVLEREVTQLFAKLQHNWLAPDAEAAFALQRDVDAAARRLKNTAAPERSTPLPPSTRTRHRRRRRSVAV